MSDWEKDLAFLLIRCRSTAPLAASTPITPGHMLILNVSVIYCQKYIYKVYRERHLQPSWQNNNNMSVIAFVFFIVNLMLFRSRRRVIYKFLLLVAPSQHLKESRIICRKVRETCMTSVTCEYDNEWLSNETISYVASVSQHKTL